MDEALEELQERQILLNVTRETMRGPRARIQDIKYTLLPTPEFIEEAKKANRRAAQLTHEYTLLVSQRPSRQVEEESGAYNISC